MSNDAKAMIHELENRRYKAMCEADTKTLDELLADSLVYTHSTAATDSKRTYLEGVRARKWNYRNIERPIEDIQVHGDCAVVTGRVRIDILIDGAPKILNSRYTNVWVKGTKGSDGRLAIHAASCMRFLAALILAFASGAFAQADYPNRPIRLIVTVPPGGAADFIARLVGGKLSESLGQPVLVESRGGAGGTIAADTVAKAAPDGYTLLQNSITTHGVGPHLYSKLPYDPVRDFSAVSGLALLPLIMVVNSELPPRTVADLIQYSKNNSLNFASSGNGGAPHMAAELFKSVTGAPIAHVPYKGSGPAVADLVGGRVQMMFDAAPSLIQHVRSGKLRVLAAGSPQRNRLLPDVPTFAELGHPKVAVSLWYGLLAPAGTPRPVIDRLNRETVKVLESIDVRERLQAQGAEPMPGTPEAFASFMQEEMAKWAPVVKQAGVKLD
jgi:tripartite-type tricarboxylate transporter receptor subunit TctC/ketosteroid isomerase-like protein